MAESWRFAGRGGYLLILLLIIQGRVSGQQKDTLIKKLDSIELKADTTGKKVNAIAPSLYNENTRITVPVYFKLLASDFKQQATKPFHMTRKDWLYFGGYAVTTFAFSFADEPLQRNALDLRNKNPGLRTFSRFVTNSGGPYEGITLALMGSYGLIFKRQKMVTTTLLSSQALITSTVFHQAIKILAGRQRPFYYDPNQVEAEPTFRGPFHKAFADASGRKIGSSFPSGHTTGAFAAATVFAMEYRDKKWVQYLAYTSATLIGLSRITENKHWITDVISGAALGYLSGKQVVNNYHRFASIKNAKSRKTQVTFRMNYSFGRLQPGVLVKWGQTHTVKS